MRVIHAINAQPWGIAPMLGVFIFDAALDRIDTQGYRVGHDIGLRYRRTHYAMLMLRRLAHLWRTLCRRDTLDRELDDEIQAAVETLADRYAAGGMSAQAARRAAVEALGGPSGIIHVKADVREGRIGAGLDAF